MADNGSDRATRDGDGDGTPGDFGPRFASASDRDPDPEAGPEPSPALGPEDEEPASAVEVDPQTEALIAAAEDASRTGAPPRPWRGPRNFLILGGALLGIAALTFYGVYFIKKLERQNAEIRMKALDQQRRKYLEERASFLARGFRPAGEEAKPLTPAQFAELQSLRRRFGLPPVPADQAATQPVRAPDATPATGRADGA